MENKQYQANLSNHTYMFCVPCYNGLLAVETAGGMLASSVELTKSNIQNMSVLVRGGTLIDMARNELVATFLNSNCDTLVFIDADIAFDWDAMKRLLAWNCLYPVVSGAYCYRMDPPSFAVGITGPQNEHGLLPVSSIGIGFTAIKRSVFTALDKLNPEIYNGDKEGEKITAYFRMPIEDGKYVGEDVYFFRKCIEAGVQPMVDPGIELGHVGPKVFNTPFRLGLPSALKQLESKE